MSACRSCDAPIAWAITETGKRMPVDAEPVVGGSILLRHRVVGEPPEAHVTSSEERAVLAKQSESRGETLRLFVSHFSTCPNAGAHRKRAA